MMLNERKYSYLIENTKPKEIYRCLFLALYYVDLVV